MDLVGTPREVTEADADAILELNLLSDLAEVGEPNSTIDEVRSDMANDFLRCTVIDDPQGGLIGFAWAEHTPGHAKTYGDLIVRPGADPAVGAVLFEWLRAKTRELGPGLPAHVFTDSKNVMKQRLYEAAGGTLIRRFYRMGIELADAPPPAVPELPDGVQIRGVAKTEADLHAMYKLVDTSFADHFAHESETYEQWARYSVEGVAKDLSLWWLATVNGDAAAGLYGSVLPESGYVDTLGTLREHRGKGLARALLFTSFAEFHRRGLRKVVLGVDATSPTGALRLYESAGMRAEHEGWRYELP